ncbi:ATP-dependent DNA helicase [Caldimonas tepidiphila]|uniref:ATP-dependent DNA helicase n=1 Tax=Caldimonas tepidiphila TaxID=2315841 RepID=UPI000E5C2531|nr:ATP-dependent DNA helicase [Caldimonas tepidiphila]
MKYLVAVRALCEFTARTGDLDLRFTPSPTAQEGIAGHAAVAARRGAGYQAELSLAGEYKALTVRGRADGYDAARNRLDEVKTHRGDLATLPDNHRALHWAQARVYGWLLCEKLGLAELQLALVYYDVGTQKETVLEERHEAAALRAFAEALCERFLAWAERELAHREARDAALAALRFPHAEFRPGQRQLAEAVYNAARSGRCLMAQAPTGIGKTVGTVFPLLKACPGQAIDRVFFLTAKGPGRRLALDALALLRGGGQGDAPAAMPLRVLELVAREQACEHPELACHGESCPLARGFYDRLPGARLAALDGRLLDRESLRAVALEHEVCPYYLGQELARWCDVAVGDYNHYFDLNALLHGLAQADGRRVALLVDEAHNLVERARRMYSAELDQSVLARLRRSAPAALKSPLERLNRCWNALNREQAEDYRAYEEPPAKLAGALQQASAAIAEHLAEHPAGLDSELLAFHFDALHFARVLELFGAHSLFELARDAAPAEGARGRRGSRLGLRNVVPAPFIAPRFAAAHTATLFSATLVPRHFHADLLGLPEDTAWVDVDSPFGAEQLRVHVVADVSTRWQHREASLAPIVALMARQYAAQPGNYLAFFSSFDYLERAAALFAERHPGIPMWQQSRGMDPAQREAFLARFAEGGRGIGFAVLGGAFGEGIDLPGERLIGAFVATLGLPPLNPVNEQIKARMQAAFGAGHDYTYLYPGLQKVVQAAGRVIRTPEDRGVVYLIDDRFAQARVRRLLPGWWHIGPLVRVRALLSGDDAAA